MASRNTATKPARQPAHPGRKRPGVDQQRALILDTAIERFSTTGTGASSVSDICKAAGISRDTFYRCFADKDELISQLYQTSVNDHMLSVMDASDLDYSDQRWLHSVMDRTIDSIIEHSVVTQFLFVEAADPESTAYRVINEAYDKVAARMRRWSKSRYGRAPSREFFVSLLVAAQWLVHNAMINGAGKAEIRKAKAAAEELYYGAFSGIATYTDQSGER